MMHRFALAAALCLGQSSDDLTALLERVKTNPLDAAAFLQLGRRYFMERGEGKPGLFYLAQGSDRQLRLLAQRDLARPETADERVAVGDAWWDVAENEPVAVQRNLRLRAVYWYRQAVAETSGLRRGRLEGRIRLVDGE